MENDLLRYQDAVERILVVGLSRKFNFDSLKDNSQFLLPKPRIEYEKAQLEKQKRERILEEKKKLKEQIALKNAIELKNLEKAREVQKAKRLELIEITHSIVSEKPDKSIKRKKEIDKDLKTTLKFASLLLLTLLLLYFILIILTDF